MKKAALSKTIHFTIVGVVGDDVTIAMTFFLFRDSRDPIFAAFAAAQTQPVNLMRIACAAGCSLRVFRAKNAGSVMQIVGMSFLSIDDLLIRKDKYARRLALKRAMGKLLLLDVAEPGEFSMIRRAIRLVCYLGEKRRPVGTIKCWPPNGTEINVGSVFSPIFTPSKKWKAALEEPLAAPPTKPLTEDNIPF